MLTFALVVLAYLCGSIPTGVLLSRRRGVDPRDVGSGNIGATNVARAAGPAAGALTLLGDTLKGAVPVLIARRLGVPQPALAAVALAAFLGHLYSCFLGFDGGKGVATGLGILLALAPLGATIGVGVFIGALAIARYVSVASLVAAATMTPVLLVTSALIAFRHRDNIRRLRFGTEPRLGVARSPSADSGVA